MAKKKEEKTNVMRILDQRKIPYTARFYEDSRGPEGTRELSLIHILLRSRPAAPAGRRWH